jgi:hypothetical protein
VGNPCGVRVFCGGAARWGAGCGSGRSTKDPNFAARGPHSMPPAAREPGRAGAAESGEAERPPREPSHRTPPAAPPARVTRSGGDGKRNRSKSWRAGAAEPTSRKDGGLCGAWCRGESPSAAPCSHGRSENGGDSRQLARAPAHGSTERGGRGREGRSPTPGRAEGRSPNA